MSNIAVSFMALFRGLERAHGTYTIIAPGAEGEKQTGAAHTLRSPVTTTTWQEHLDGKTRVGIVPINDDNECHFGAIDIDIYPLDVSDKAKRIAALNLPLCCCRSKSGGLHAYLFTSEPVTAAIMRTKLIEMAALIGHGGCEVFPKQVEVFKEKGDVGNWINMPYFGGDNTKCYGLNKQGIVLDTIDFLAYATEAKVSRKWLENWGEKESQVKEFKEGPPCLNVLGKLGIGEGQRNDGLFNVGVFLYKRNKDTWDKELQEYNKKFCKPPVPPEEVSNIADSIIRKGQYVYTCSRAPIQPHCNRGVCCNRKFGIGALVGAVVMTGLSKFDARPPTWFATITTGQRIELETEDLQSQERFQKKCMDWLNVMPQPLKKNDWRDRIANLLEHVNVIPAPPEATPEGRMLELLEKFCTGRLQAKSKDELILGKVWTDGGYHYFKLSDFLSMLDRLRFRDMKTSQITSAINISGGKTKQFNIKGKCINTWAIPEFALIKEMIDVPVVTQKDVM